MKLKPVAVILVMLSMVSTAEAAKLKSTNRLDSRELQILVETGRRIERSAIGGNSGAVLSAVIEKRYKRDSWTGMIRQLIKSGDSSGWLENIRVSVIRNPRKNLAGAVEDLLSYGGYQDPQESDYYSILAVYEKIARERGRSIVLLRGSLAGGIDYRANLIAAIDRRTREIVVMIQGYSQ